MEELLSKKMKVKKNTPLNTITNILSIGLDKYDRKKLKANDASLKNIYDMLGIKSKLKGSKLKGLKLKGSKLKGSNGKKNIKQLGGNINKLSDLLKAQNEEIIKKKCHGITGIDSNFIKNITYIPLVENIKEPDDIIIFLNRGKYAKKTNELKRDNTPIHIDKELKFNDKKYYISAIVQNQATVVESGHYTTLAKRGENIWKELNDSNCKDININNYLNNNTYGVIFLYRNTKKITIDTVGNGIENKGNTCYLNSLLQFLITTDEYQNKEKMIKTRPELYKFLNNSTKKSKNLDINDGSTSEPYVKEFGLDSGQQEASDELLRKINNFNKFKYSDDTYVFKLEQKPELENNKFIETKYNTLKHNDWFVTNPPFYNYVTQIKTYPSDKAKCTEDEKTHYHISNISILSKNEKENENEDNKVNENEDNKVNEGEGDNKVNENEDNKVNEGEKETEGEGDNKVNENEDNKVNEKEKETENENEDNKEKEGEGEKPILEATVINTGVPRNKTDKTDKKLPEKGIERVIKQLSIMKDTIPDIKNLKEAVVGKDMITELVRQEKIMKLMTANALINATMLQQQEENNKKNYTEDYDKHSEIINNKLKILNTKMNDINILFNKLFHRRNKLSSVPIVWVN